MSILVLDIGTTSMRGILYDGAGEKLAVKQVPGRVIFREKGVVEEDASDWIDNTVLIIKCILSNENVSREDVEAVAITSQRSSIIPIDASGAPLMDTIMWQDTRNLDLINELSSNNDWVFRRTGSRINTVYSGGKMAWVRRARPDIYAKVHKFVTIPEYINLKMTGSFCSDYTYGSRSGLMDLREKKWDDELLELYGVDKEKLLPLKESGQPAGYTSSDFEKLTGLPAGIPVIHSGGDQQCAAIGQGVTKSGNVSIVLGTGGFLMAACDEVPEHLTDNVICNCSAMAGKYVIEANILAMSAASDWFVREIYGMDEPDFEFIENELGSVKGVTAPLVIPYLKGRGVPDWNSGAKAVFADLTLATTRAELYKSLMESLFLEFRNHLDVFSSYVEIGEIFVSGGMTKNRTLCKLLGDVIARRITGSDDKESTALGALIIASTGLGHYADAEEAFRAFSKNERRSCEPDPSLGAAYGEKQQRMNEYYRRNI